MMKNESLYLASAALMVCDATRYAPLMFVLYVVETLEWRIVSRTFWTLFYTCLALGPYYLQTHFVGIDVLAVFKLGEIALQAFREAVRTL